jgi:nicotinamidase/pyrazinamidase
MYALLLDALQLGYQTRVLMAGCRGVNLNPGDIDAATQAMRAKGAVMMESESRLI